METWKTKPKEDGSNTHQIMLLNGTKMLARPLALMSQNAACTQFLPNKTFTKSESNQWLKSHIKLKTKAKIFSLLKGMNKNWPFQNKTLPNLHSDAQNQPTTEIRIYSLSFL